MEHLIPCQDLGKETAPRARDGAGSIPEQQGGTAEGGTSPSATPAHGNGVGLSEIPAWLILAALASPTPLLPRQQRLVELQGGWDMPGGAASLDTALNSAACSGGETWMILGDRGHGEQPLNRGAMPPVP